MITLRRYQAECLEAVQAAWRRGIQCPAVVLPTGSGKTVIFAELAQRFIREGRGRVLVLVHRDELAAQAVDKIRKAAPHLTVGRVQGADDEVHEDIVVASVQTLSHHRRLHELTWSQAGDPSAVIGLVIHDECHHTLSETYMAIRDAFAHAVQVGFTATFERGDGGPLPVVWQEVAYTRSIWSMVRDGYLVPVRGRSVTVGGMDLSGVKRRGGDYAARPLAAVMTQSGAPVVIASAMRRYATGRRSLVFCPDVVSATATAGAIGTGAALVTGTTPRDARNRIYEAFRAGEIRTLVSCMVLTEGFDMPEADCAVIARPTRSRPLYKQMVGRVLRPFPGKSDALVLDIVGATWDSELCLLPCLEPGLIRPDDYQGW